MMTASARTLAAWIAICAMLVATLAPALSQAAYRASGDAMWLEICTAYGIEHVAGAGAAQDPADDAERPVKPCVFCSLFASALPVPWGAAGVPAAQGGDVVAAFTLHAPRPRLPWAASRPRAPPAYA